MTNLLTTLAACAIILSKSDQAQRVATYQSPDSTEDEQHGAEVARILSGARQAEVYPP